MKFIYSPDTTYFAWCDYRARIREIHQLHYLSKVELPQPNIHKIHWSYLSLPYSRHMAPPPITHISTNLHIIHQAKWQNTHSLQSVWNQWLTLCSEGPSMTVLSTAFTFLVRSSIPGLFYTQTQMQQQKQRGKHYNNIQALQLILERLRRSLSQRTLSEAQRGISFSWPNLSNPKTP